MVLLVRVVHQLVVPVKHGIVQYAVSLGVKAGGDAEVIDERLRREHAAQVQCRGVRVPEVEQVRRGFRTNVVVAETVEGQHDQRRRGLGTFLRQRGGGRQAHHCSEHGPEIIREHCS